MKKEVHGSIDDMQAMREMKSELLKKMDRKLWSEGPRNPGRPLILHTA